MISCTIRYLRASHVKASAGQQTKLSLCSPNAVCCSCRNYVSRDFQMDHIRDDVERWIVLCCFVVVE